LVENFNAISENRLKNRLIDTLLKVSVSQIDYGAMTYDSGLLNLTVRHLDMGMVKELQQQFKRVNNENLKAAQKHGILMSLWQESYKLLNKGGDFEVQKFQLSTKEGLLIGNAKLSLPKHESSSPAALFQLIHKANFHAMFEAPTAWLRKAFTKAWMTKMKKHQLFVKQHMANQNAKFDNNDPDPFLLSEQDIHRLSQQKGDEQLADLIKQGLVIEKDDKCRTEFYLHEGKFTVNSDHSDDSVSVDERVENNFL